MPALTKDWSRSPKESYLGHTVTAHRGSGHARQARRYTGRDAECEITKPLHHAAQHFKIHLSKDWSVVQINSPTSLTLLSEDEIIFRGLVANWKRATEDYSVIAKRYRHPSYKAILGMNATAVPLILKELRREPDHWFAALEQLTGKNPAKEAKTFYEAVDLWIAWGVSEGLIS